MEEKNLDSWDKFKIVVDEIRENYGYHELSKDKEHTLKRKNVVLFRGQPNLPVKTTLERKTTEEFTLGRYLLFTSQIIDEIETLTGLKWNVPDSEVSEINKNQSHRRVYLPQNWYAYLVYLRHHGYPSPLLDWTTSPYIAAYFALCESPLQKDVAIYAYIEYVNPIKAIENPLITVMGPYVSTHKRHFAQKAWYTMASKWSDEFSTHTFCSHHEIFDKSRKNYETPQDLLIKITIPASERGKALKELDNDYNINHFTLFQTEDSLIKALGIRDFET
ncbi:MAG: FRG domain-containing protein [Anaerolineales bacterium]|nr:FRG domain-containing protein [Anaerolineales bacterium]